MSMSGEIELAETSISIYKSEINDLHKNYGHGLRPAWVLGELENLYDDDSESDDLEEFSMQIIKQLESKISNLEGVLDSSEIEGKERDSIIKEIERINLKIDAIKLV